MRTARVREAYEAWMKGQGVSAIFGERRFTQELKETWCQGGGQHQGHQ